MRSLFMLILVMAAPLLTLAQTQPGPANPICGNDHINRSQSATNNVYEQLVKQFRGASASPKNNNSRLADELPLYTIPVVFIVYHLGEAIGTGSNVSDADIQAILARTNNYYRTTGTAPFLGTDSRIQFALAKRTPTCPSVATTGIVRVDGRTIPAYNATNGVLNGDSDIERGLRAATPDFPRADADGVLVIRVVKNISYAAGYGIFGGDVVLGSQYISTARFNSFLAHEIGHVFTLYHTFAGEVLENGVFSCPPNDNPDTDGDQVADTEPHIEPEFSGAASCPAQQTAINACTGQVYGPVIYNHMNYAYCQETQFTPGQITRMRTAIAALMPTLLDESFLSPPVPAAEKPCLVSAACSVSVGTTPGNYANGIYSVRFGQISNSSSFGTSSIPFYNDFSYFYRTSVKAGSAVQIKIGSYSSTRAYIDYNNDGAFNETTELVWQSTNSYSAGILNKGTVQIPTNAVMNTYLRLRVISDQSSNPTACFLPGYPGYGYGEVEDYAVQIVADAPRLPIVRHVRAGATGSGLSWADASGSLTDMLEAAQEDDTVKVATGVYRPLYSTALNTSALDPRYRTFLIPAAVLVFGGYAGTGNTPNARTIGSGPGSTTLSGDIGILGDNSDNAYNVVTFILVSAGTRLDGFVVTGGNGNPYFSGSGIRNDGGRGTYISSPTIANCQIVNNLGGGMKNETCGGVCRPTLLNCIFRQNIGFQGGAILNQPECSGSCSAIITDCQFLSNTATGTFGGAIFNTVFDSDNRLLITRCVFSGNQASGGGGAIATTGAISTTVAPSTVTATQCRFENNTAPQGGAVYSAGASSSANSVSIQFNRCWFLKNRATGGSIGGGAVLNYGGSNFLNSQFSNCAFVGNQAVGANGGAIHNFLNELPGNGLRLTNCTFTSNSATQGGAIYNYNSAPSGQTSQTAINCIVWGNTAPNGPTLFDNSSSPNFLFRYSITEGRYAEPGTGNLDSNPLFVNPSAGDFSLSATSPARNAGNPTTTTATAGPLDLAGNIRLAESRIDMGAFEFIPPLCVMQTIKAGNWNDETVWSCGRIPTAIDAVQVRHVIVIPANFQANALRIVYDIGSKLTINALAKLRLNN
jgi:predicted outer membrane repeat protein